MTENRNGLIVQVMVTEASTSQEWDAAIELLSKQTKRRRQTVGADKGYDVSRFIDPCRELGMTPHVASKIKGNRIDGRTTNHKDYEISQKKRKRVEEPFGWMKTFGLMHKLRHRGEQKVGWQFRFTASAYNITRLHGLMV